MVSCIHLCPIYKKWIVIVVAVTVIVTVTVFVVVAAVRVEVTVNTVLAVGRVATAASLRSPLPALLHPMRTTVVRPVWCSKTPVSVIQVVHKVVYKVVNQVVNQVVVPQ